MPKETLSSQDLVSDTRQSRFLRELSDHLEDSGDLASLGAPHELAESFNRYAVPRRNLRLLLIAIVAVITFIIPTLMTSQPPSPIFTYLPQSLNVAINFTGIVIIMPIMWAIYLPVTALMGVLIESPIVSNTIGGLLAAQTYNYIENLITQSLPILACIFWTVTATTLLFAPYEIFKRNLKRRA